MSVSLKHTKEITPKNILVITIPSLPYFDKMNFTRKINDRFLNFWIKHYVKKYDFNDSFLLFFEPRFSCILGHLNHKLIWYDVADDRMQFQEIKNWYLSYLEKLSEEADLITTSSETLFDQLSKYKKNNIYLIPNGVDVDHFITNTKTQCPADLTGIKKPILGYVGTIGEWFDFDLIKKILIKYPDMSIVVIGYLYQTQKQNMIQLKKFKNFHFLGVKCYLELPSYVQQFSCCIIPFKINKLTKSVNPLKLYEYSASGKYTVSTELQEIKKYSDYVYLAKDHDDFLNLIQSALQNNDGQQLIEFAQKHNWNVIVDRLIRILKTYC
jgi:glycosyltransferase involved in cell wall biosynthesis